MNICVINMEASGWGGIYSIVNDLVKGLLELGHTITFIRNSFDKTNPESWTIDYTDMARLNLIEVDPDRLAIEKNMWIPLSERYYVCYRDQVAAFEGIVHDHSHGKLSRKLHPRTLKTMHNQANEIFDDMVFISRAQLEWFKERHNLPIPRPPIVYHGIDPGRFIYSEKKGDYYLFLSVMGFHKGPDVVVDLAERFPEERFIFVGRDDGYGIHLVQKAQIMDNIRYLGEIKEDAKKSLLAHAKALIFCPGGYQTPKGQANLGQHPWIECFGLVAVEAFASGTPVIALNNGAVPEVVQHGTTGFVCDEFECMAQVIEEERCKEISPIRCQSVVERKFNYTRMAKDYIGLYEQLDA